MGVLANLQIPSQQQAVQALTQAIESNDYGHAWAFIGPAGVGQDRAARIFAAYANAEGGEPDEATIDMFLRGAHPAITTIVPIKEYRKEDVQSWNNLISYKLLVGTVRVIHITKAETLNNAAANAFLKSLEEPPYRTVWILDVADPSAIPDTILSRCRIVRFAPYTVESLNEYLDSYAKDLSSTDRQLVLSISEGTPMKAQSLCNPDALAEYKTARLWIANTLREGPGYGLVANKLITDSIKRRVDLVDVKRDEEIETTTELYGGSLSSKLRKEITDRYERQKSAERVNTIQDGFDALSGWVRDVLLAHSLLKAGLSPEAICANPKQFRNVDIVPEILGATNGISPRALIALTEYIDETKARINLNGKTDLAIITTLIQGQTLAFTLKS